MPLSNQKSIGEAINEFLRHFKLEEKITETRIAASWEKVMGKHIAKYTRRIVLKNGVLYVYVESAVMRNELLMARQKIKDMINQETGKDVIEDVVVR